MSDDRTAYEEFCEALADPPPPGGRREDDNYPTPAWAIRAILAEVLWDAMDPRRRTEWSPSLSNYWSAQSFRAGPILRVLDPCCGNDGFASELARLFGGTQHGLSVAAVDVRPDAVEATQAALDWCLRPPEGYAKRRSSVAIAGDFLEVSLLELDCDPSYDLVITNPPYTSPGHGAEVVRAIVERSLDMVRPGGSVVMLVRTSWLGDGEDRYGRATWLRSSPPDVFALDRRPCFVRSVEGRASTDRATYAAVRWIKGRGPDAQAIHRTLITDQTYTRAVLAAMGLDVEHIAQDLRAKKRRAKA